MGKTITVAYIRPRSLHIAEGLQTYRILKFVVCPFGMDSVLVMEGKCCGRYVIKLWGEPVGYATGPVLIR